MDLGNGLGHLTYSTLVHPADDWEQLYHSLVTYLPKVKARIAGNKSFGVCIRLSANSAATLANSAAERDKLKKFLGDNDMYIYTANAFVYGHFKGDKVKEQVYEPDWRGEERTQYTINVANILADVCPAGIAPSIQSAPLGFKPRVTGDDVVDAYTDHVLRVVAHLVALEVEDRTHRAAGARAGAVLLSRNHRRDRRVFQQASLFRRRGRKSSPSSRSCRSPKPTKRCAAISASSTTSAIRRSNTRTSPSRCRSWSTAACRSSSCRRPPPCISRK